jgi:uncharacterized protein (DUF58 family)
MRPAQPLLWVLLLWVLIGGLVSFHLLPTIAWLASGLFCLVLFSLDAFALHGTASPELVRDIPAVLPVGIEREVGLRLQTFTRRRLRCDVHDLHPGHWLSFGLPRQVTLTPHRELAMSYRITPAERGSYEFPGCQLRLYSPFGLWRQVRTLPVKQSIRAFPNFAPLAKFALFSSEQASRVVGAHLKRRRGEGTEFHQLREYRLGDSMRQIDWKATQRARKLISRDYQDEKNQQVLLLIDTGRRMLAKDDALSHFDHVLNASLVVSYLALRQGDAVGLMASGGASRWLPPQRGLGTVDTLLDCVYDLQAQAVATDYLAAATQLSLRQPRRSLIMLITNVRDEDIEDLMVAVRLLQKRHLVCVASLREQALDTTLLKPVESLNDAILASAMARYLAERARAHAALRSQGVFVLDVTCAELPAALVERYLAVKRDGLL